MLTAKLRADAAIAQRLPKEPFGATLLALALSRALAAAHSGIADLRESSKNLRAMAA